MNKHSEVLARKYRPKSFDELIGQETIAQTLSLALDSERLSHAYLFSGLRGSGKTSTARIFAKALICEKGITHKPCGVCSNCTMAIENRHMDIIEMDAASSRKIDDIRDLIEQTKYRPAVARFKIFIIDEVHMLTKEAFNALLKTLEEPPSYVKFILATTDPLKLPATILSRTQHFRFKRIAHNKIVSHLAHILSLEGIEYENGSLEILARSGSGSLRDTLTLLDQAIIYSKGFVDIKTVTDMLGLIDPNFIEAIFNAIFAKEYARVVTYIQELEDYEAEVVVDEFIAYLKERMYNHDPLFSTLVLDRFFRILSDAKSLFSINAESSFVLSLVFFKMIEALRVKEIDQMIESLQKDVQRPQSISLENSLKEPTAPRSEPLERADTPEPIRAPQPSQIDENEQKFHKLIALIKDRNSELGECFGNQVKYLSYENETLTWESCADDECKERLKHGYPIIRHFVQELYGIATKIKASPCSREILKSEPEPESSHADTSADMEEFQSPSMYEDTQIGGSASCITNCADANEGVKEFDRDAILQTPMVQKAIEIFEAKKLTVQEKI
ncbi:MAG: DNA polymerase III subunit gamma/tau [Epsilonproteobacteria bacterium]|nr:DNA polymerase III subunit gamma/tau [Campylobacterota bacterium]